MNRHKHYNTDSVSVCDECDINLRLVNTLGEHQIFSWGDVRTARSVAAFISMKGIGRQSQNKLNKIRILTVDKEKTID